MNKDSKNWARRHPILTGFLVVIVGIGFGSAILTGSNGGFWIMWILLAYFFPAVIASSKEKPNTGAVFALNLLLGWTIIGWVVALIWALTNSSEKQTVTVNHPTSQADELKKLAELKESGILSQEEFDRKKQSILGA